MGYHKTSPYCNLHKEVRIGRVDDPLNLSLLFTNIFLRVVHQKRQQKNDLKVMNREDPVCERNQDR
jgi:hypothetical protein